ncbi:unnamed protein product [Merluccius merluccius]
MSNVSTPGTLDMAACFPTAMLTQTAFKYFHQIPGSSAGGAEPRRLSLAGEPGGGAPSYRERSGWQRADPGRTRENQEEPGRSTRSAERSPAGSVSHTGCLRGVRAVCPGGQGDVTRLTGTKSDCAAPIGDSC